jgi:hypothetical protein
MSGLVAKVVTKGYHLYALPTFTNRLRVLSDWILGTLTPNQDVRLALVHDDDTAEVAPTSPPLMVLSRSAASEALKRSSTA